jgi:hypothetical protein
MHYFTFTVDNGVLDFSRCSGSMRAIDSARRIVLSSDRSRGVKAGAFQIGGSQAPLIYLCQIDQDGLFQEA